MSTRQEKLLAMLLIDQMKRFHGVFGNDTALIRDKAKAHGIAITTGDILTPPKPGAYNLRLPNGKKHEVAALLKAKKVVVACIDARQSWEVYDIEEPDIFIADAGGATQPSFRRLEATENLLMLIHQVNPEVELVLLGHDNICGGVNHATSGRIYTIRQTQGVEAERTELTAHLSNLHARLTRRGVPGEKIRLGIARIGQADDFLGILPVQPSPLSQR